MNTTTQTSNRQQRIRRTASLSLLIGLLLALGLILSPSAVLAGEEGPTVRWHFSFPGGGDMDMDPAFFAKPLPQDPTVFNDDLTVSGGEFFTGDVVVYGGDVKIEGGGGIGGDLYVYNGDVKIRGGGNVGGDVIVSLGDVELSGGATVDGGVYAAFGDVKLSDGAIVGGDVSVVGGDIDRSAGAIVRGNVLTGPNIDIPQFPNLPGAPEIEIPGAPQPMPERSPRFESASAGSGFANWFLGFILDLFRAAFFTLVAVIGTGLIAVNRPRMVERALSLLDEDPRTSFGVGLLANMVVMIFLWMWLGSLSAGFLVALCLSPLLLPLGLIALAIELAGLSVVGRWLGDRISNITGFDWEPLPGTAVGVTLLVGTIGFLWALTSCLGWITLILVGAPGVGALLIGWRERRSSGLSGGSASSADIVVPASVSTPDPAVPAPSSALDPDTVEAILDGGPETVEVRGVTGRIDTSEAVDVADFDFAQLSGIGPVFSMRLRAANVRTLGDLAAMTPESLADVLNVSPERVIRDDLLGQARRLLGLE